MSKPDAWMPWYIGDYLADTMHLSTVQHGAYLLLIAAYWRNGGPLDDDDMVLATIVRLTSGDWRKMRTVIAAFFRIDDGKWNHRRVDEELAAARRRQDRAAAGGRGKAGNKHDTSSPQAGAQPLLNGNSNGAPQPSPPPIYKNSRSGVQPSAGGASAKQPASSGPLDTSSEGPMAALAAENRRRNSLGQPPMNAAEIAAWQAARRKDAA